MIFLNAKYPTTCGGCDSSVIRGDYVGLARVALTSGRTVSRVFCRACARRAAARVAEGEEAVRGARRAALCASGGSDD